MSTEKQFTYPKTFLPADVFGQDARSVRGVSVGFRVGDHARSEPRVTAFDGRQVTAVLDASRDRWPADVPGVCRSGHDITWA